MNKLLHGGYVDTVHSSCYYCQFNYCVKVTTLYGVERSIVLGDCNKQGDLPMQ